VINPDEELRAANPVNEHDLADAPDSPFAQALFRKITGAPYHPRIRPVRRRRPLKVYAGSLVAVLATGVGVGYALVGHHATRQSVVSCYAEARLDAHVVEVTAAGSDPIAACQSMWALGHVPGQPVVRNEALTACVLPSGLAGVFPDTAGTVCRRLRLTPIDARPSATTTPAESPVISMMNTVAAALANGCLTIDQANLLVRGALDRAGLPDWKVTQGAPSSAARPCASPAFDEPNHLVRLIPVPKK